MTRLEALEIVRTLVEQYGSRLRTLPKDRYKEIGEVLSIAGISIMSCTVEKIDREISRLNSDPLQAQE